MVEVNVFRDSDNNIKGYSVSGHAGAGNEGHDIVCSAVSAVAYTGVASLLNMAGGCEYSAQKGDLRCFISEDTCNEDKVKARIILESIIIGFMQLENSYSKFVRLVEEEV
jgi:uncharacterized protein YsxB (DUF464 family)